jgi:tetratricopeptide (TPR) repeat protein
MARVTHLDELDRIQAAGVNWLPVRRALGITGFGVNAYRADRGERLIEEHEESGGGAGAHEELYVIVSGHATFNIDATEIDAPTGTLVFVPEPTSRRGAIARADGTTALVVGGPAGTIRPSPWEYYFAALPAAEAGEPAEAYKIAAAGLSTHPDNPSLQYNLACFASRAGDADRALEHLARAFAGDPRTREWAQTDSDLDMVRADPRWPR